MPNRKKNTKKYKLLKRSYRWIWLFRERCQHKRFKREKTYVKKLYD